MRATLNGLDMFYSTIGSGPPIVLIHGFPLDHTIWDPQADELSRNHTVITPDLRGHGQSQVTTGPYTMDLLASDIHALLDHQRLGRVVLGGLSLGGYVTFAFLNQFPHRVKALILADTRAQADTPEAMARREQQAQTVLKNGSGELTNQIISKMFTETTIANNPALTEKVRKMMESTSLTGIAGALRGMAKRPDSRQFLGSIKVPTLIIVGSEDSLSTVNDAQIMRDRIADSELVIVPEAAHLTTLEKPHEVNSAIRRFLDRIQVLD